MTYSAEFIVNTGQYEHVLVTVKADDAHQMMDRLDDFSDKLKVKLGIFDAELKSWVIDAYDKAMTGQQDAAAQLLKDALGASVVEVIKTEPKPVQTASEPAQQDNVVKFPLPSVTPQTPPWKDDKW